MYIDYNNETFETQLELMQIEVTGCCNMKCKHCRASEMPRVMINLEQMNKILDFINKTKSDNFKLNLSGGEPFMNPYLYDILKLIKDKGVDEVVITSNGSLITEDWLKRINDLNYKFLCIQISIDSIKPDNHDKFRGYPGAFDKLDNVLEMIKKYPNISSSIRMTISKDTFTEMDDMVTYALSKGCKILGFGSIIPFGRAENGNMSMVGLDKKKFVEKLISLRNANKGKIDIVTEDPLKFLKLHEDDMLKLQVDISDPCVFGGCTAGISSLNINSDGNVTPCSMMSEVVFNINKCKDEDEMIVKYENSDVIKKLFSRKYSGKCGKCKLNRICGGCRAAAKAYTGDYMGSDLSCWKGDN